MGIQLNGTSGTDVISAVDGSLTVEGLTISGDFNIADKIIHSGDTNTAIRFPADDTISFETSGYERLRITSGGYLQLQGGHVYGDDSATATLRLQNTSGNNNHSRIEIGAIQNSDNGGIHFYTAGSSTSTRYMTLKGGGNLGIGIDNPTSRLYVNGVSTSDIITARAADTNGASVINILAEGTTGISRIKFSDTAAATGDGWISYYHSDRAIAFATAGVSNERLRITSSGGCHIGSPSITKSWDTHAISLTTNSATFACPGTLTLFGGTGFGTANMAGAGLRFVGYYDANNFTTFAHVAGVKENTTSGDYGGALTFHTRVNGGLGAERLRINSTGVISFDKGTTAAVTPSQTTAASIGGGAMSGGSSWFNHGSGTDYFGVDGDHKLTNGTTYGKIVARNASGTISNATEAGHTWFLVCKTVAGTLGNSNWVVEPVAGWKMAWPTSLSAGATTTFYMRDAVESYGSPTIPASGDYYIGWCYSTSQQMGTNGGSYYVDDTTGGKIYYYSNEGDMSNAHQWIPRQGDSWDATMTAEKIHFKFETLPKADLTGTVFASPLLVDPVMQGTPLVDGFPMGGGQLVKDVQWATNTSSIEFMNADFVNSNYLLTYSINASDGNSDNTGWYQTRMQFCDHDGSWKNSTNDYVSHCEWMHSTTTTATYNSTFAGYAQSMWLTGNGSNYNHMGWVWIIPSNFRHNRNQAMSQNWGDGTSYTSQEHPQIMVRGHSFLTSGNAGQSYREEGGGIYRGSNDLYTLSGFRLFGCGASDITAPSSNGSSNGYVRIWRFKSGFEAREVS